MKETSEELGIEAIKLHGMINHAQELIRQSTQKLIAINSELESRKKKEDTDAE